jgi:hypothetical protein
MDYIGNIKTKNELIDELSRNGFNHEFVFRTLTNEQKKKIIEFYVKNNLIKDDFVFSYLRDGFDKIALIVYDTNKNIVGLSFLQELIIERITLSFFTFSYYVSKNCRLIGIKPSIVHKILYPLTYYESHDYVLKHNIKNVYGISIHIGNNKLRNKHIKKLCSPALDEYFVGTYIGNNEYIWYYPNMYY